MSWYNWDVGSGEEEGITYDYDVGDKDEGIEYDYGGSDQVDGPEVEYVIEPQPIEYNYEPEVSSDTPQEQESILSYPGEQQYSEEERIAEEVPITYEDDRAQEAADRGQDVVVVEPEDEEGLGIGKWVGENKELLAIFGSLLNKGLGGYLSHKYKPKSSSGGGGGGKKVSPSTPSKRLGVLNG